MATVWLYTLTSVVAVSGLSLIGAVSLTVKPETFERALLLLISFAAGALLGDTFLHLIPEMAESEYGLDLPASSTLLAGVIGFFLLEKALHWHHAHLPSEEVLHPVAVTNLVGDALHNFIDGSLIAGAFLVSTPVGVATAVAVMLHEIPQELGDFAILVHAGLEARKALALNLLSALVSVVGAVITLVVAEEGIGVERTLLPLTAGGFLYIASTDLIPELHKEPEVGKSVVQVLALLAGVGVMAALLTLD